MDEGRRGSKIGKKQVKRQDGRKNGEGENQSLKE